MLWTIFQGYNGCYTNFSSRECWNLRNTATSLIQTSPFYFFLSNYPALMSPISRRERLYIATGYGLIQCVKGLMSFEDKVSYHSLEHPFCKFAHPHIGPSFSHKSYKAWKCYCSSSSQAAVITSRAPRWLPCTWTKSLGTRMDRSNDSRRETRRTHVCRDFVREGQCVPCSVSSPVANLLSELVGYCILRRLVIICQGNVSVRIDDDHCALTTGPV